MKQLNFILPIQKINQSLSYCTDIGKTERILWERAEENVYNSNKKKEEGTIFEHLLIL